MFGSQKPARTRLPNMTITPACHRTPTEPGVGGIDGHAIGGPAGIVSTAPPTPDASSFPIRRVRPRHPPVRQSEVLGCPTWRWAEVARSGLPAVANAA